MNLTNWISPASLWGLGAAIPAVLAEYLYRKLTGSWASHLYLWIPLQLSIGYCIYRLVTVPHQSLLDSFLFWSFSTTFMRIFVTVILLGDAVKAGTWFALGLIVMARVAQTFWGR